MMKMIKNNQNNLMMNKKNNKLINKMNYKDWIILNNICNNKI